MKLLAAESKAEGHHYPGAIYNAFTVDMALGGSTNSVLHLMAIATRPALNSI